jgi:hypothetical protein
MDGGSLRASVQRLPLHRPTLSSAFRGDETGERSRRKIRHGYAVSVDAARGQDESVDGEETAVVNELPSSVASHSSQRQSTERVT